MRPAPKSEHEWTVHSINIHGIFFERWCQRVFSEAPGWKVHSVNYPVEFPPTSGPNRGQESALDIRESKDVGDLRLSLLIECKKNSPEFVNWVFFKKPSEKPSEVLIASQVRLVLRDAPNVGWGTSSSQTSVQATFVMTDAARETRANYLKTKSTGDNTKTSNSAIQDAAYQVALAKQAVAREDYEITDKLG